MGDWGGTGARVPTTLALSRLAFDCVRRFEGCLDGLRRSQSSERPVVTHRSWTRLPALQTGSRRTKPLFRGVSIARTMLWHNSLAVYCVLFASCLALEESGMKRR